MSSSEKNSGPGKAESIFKAGASFQKNDTGRKSTRAVNKQGVIDYSKAIKEKSKDIKAQKNKFQAAFKDVRVNQQRSAAVDSRTRGNKIDDRRNLLATDAQLKQQLYKQKQQQLHQKKQGGKFNLGDEGNAEYEQSMTSRDTLTHGGKSINDLSEAELRAFTGDGSDNDNDDFHQISREETRAHFGGGVLTGEQLKFTRLDKGEWEKLSVQDKYKFLLQVSKQNRADRQGKKALDEKLLEDLDLDFDNIRNLLEFSRGDDDEDEYIDIDSSGRYKPAALSASKGQSKDEYMSDMLAKYGINANGDDDDDNSDEDDDESGSSDDESGQDGDDDSDDSDEADDIHEKLRSAIAMNDDEQVAQLYKQKVQQSHSKLALAVEEGDGDMSWERSMASTSSKIGLDGKAIDSASLTLKTGLAIGSNTARDDYLAMAHTLQSQSRASAGSRLVSDQEKAEKHRNYLLYLEQRRIKRKKGELGENDEDDDELSRQYEALFTTRRGQANFEEKQDDHLLVKAMKDGDDSEDGDDYDVDVSTGLQSGKSKKPKTTSPSSDDSDMDDEDDYDDEDDDSSEDEAKVEKKTKYSATSGDSLDQDYLLDDEVDGIDYDDYDDEEIELMETGGETKQLFKNSKQDQRGRQSRRDRKNDLGIFVNDIDTVLQSYYLSTDNVEYRTFIAKIKVTIRDEIPYNYDFPNNFNEFITMLFNHTVPIVTIYTEEMKKLQSTVDKLQIAKTQPESNTSSLSPTSTIPASKFSLLTESNLRGHICSLIIGRIFQLYHPRISTSNEVRIEILYRLLWRLLKIITTQYQQIEASKQSNQKLSKAYLAYTLYDVLAISDVITSYLFTINELLPRYTGRACIGLMEFFAESAKAPQLGAVLPEKDKEERQLKIQSARWGRQVVTVLPEVHELFAYKVLMHLYPLSDARHTIMTPLQLLLSQIATQSYVLSNIDLVKAMFVIGLLLEIWRNNDKIVPECFATVQSMLAVLNNSYLQNQDPSIVHNLQRLKNESTEAALAQKQKEDLANAAEKAEKTAKAAQKSLTSTSATDAASILASQKSSKSTASKSTVQSTTTTTTTQAEDIKLLALLQSTGKTTPSQPGDELLYRPLPVMLESWREHQCRITPHTVESISTLPSQLSHRDQRSTGILPLQWLFITPESTSQTSTEYFRVVMIETLCSFVTTLALRSRSNVSCNELLSPLVETLQCLTANIQLFIKNLDQSPQPTTKSKKSKSSSSLLETSAHLSKYNQLLSTLTKTTTMLQETAAESLVGRKPLEKYAAVIVPKDFEPRLDFEEKFNDPRRAQQDRQVKDRKRLERQLTDQKKQMRKDVRKVAFGKQLEQQRLNQIKDEKRKSQLARARALVQADGQRDIQNNKNFKKQRR